MVNPRDAEEVSLRAAPRSDSAEVCMFFLCMVRCALQTSPVFVVWDGSGLSLVRGAAAWNSWSVARTRVVAVGAFSDAHGRGSVSFTCAGCSFSVCVGVFGDDGRPPASDRRLNSVICSMRGISSKRGWCRRLRITRDPRCFHVHESSHAFLFPFMLPSLQRGNHELFFSLHQLGKVSVNNGQALLSVGERGDWLAVIPIVVPVEVALKNLAELWDKHSRDLGNYARLGKRTAEGETLAEYDPRNDAKIFQSVVDSARGLPMVGGTGYAAEMWALRRQGDMLYLVSEMFMGPIVAGASVCCAWWVGVSRQRLPAVSGLSCNRLHVCAYSLC